MTTAVPTPPRSLAAGLVVIGNEVLSAKIRDENTPFLLDRLARAGIRVAEVAMLPDVTERIALVVRDFSQRFDLVITTGGVGPTHDDCTWKAVAAALERPLELHAEMVERIERRLGQRLTPEQARMAWLPAGTQLVGADGRWPTLVVGNVYVLPGVPSMVVGRVEQLCQTLVSSRPHLATAWFDVDEWTSVAEIDQVVAEFGDLEIGSYPVFDQVDHKLRLTFEGWDRQRVAAAVARIVEKLGSAHLVRTCWRDDAEAGGPSAEGAGS